MKHALQTPSFEHELEAVFSECAQNISVAIKEYERDIHGALELVKRDCLKRTRLS